jgi:hypothetical protein
MKLDKPMRKRCHETVSDLISDRIMMMTNIYILKKAKGIPVTGHGDL